MSEITATIKILPAGEPPLYLKHAQKVAELKLLGITYRQIAKSLGLGITTVKKAYRKGAN